MNLFKKIVLNLIGIEVASIESVSETPYKIVEHYAVKWEYKTGWGGDVYTKYKVFTDEDLADEYVKYLKNCAEAIGCYIKVSKSKNK